MSRMTFRLWLGTFWLVGFASTFVSARASDTRVVFDIPSKVECKDVTPEVCRSVHPTMKVVEMKVRISATIVDGSEASIADFVYLISSTDMRLKVLDFLPNTTLESSTAEDRIEVTDSTENTDAVTGDARVSYSLLSIGASKNLSNKKSESNHYQRIAPKHLVLASGTVNRGYGAFFKLRPSRDGSLEGAKEFALLCFVPKEWRGDWVTVTCSARVNKKGSKTAIAGIEQAHVGLYMSGDREASDLADELTNIQLSHDGLLSKDLSKEAVHLLETMHSIPSSQMTKFSTGEWFHLVKFRTSSKPSALEKTRKALHQIEEQFAELAAANTK